MGFIKRKHRPEYAAVQREWAMWVKQMEKTLPGYGEQNEALHWMVRILTGVRVLYCLFYLIMTFVYGMEKTNAVMTLLGPFIFYGWYMLMLRESPVLTGVDADRAWGEYCVGRRIAASDELVAAISAGFHAGDGGGNRLYRGGILHLYAV